MADETAVAEETKEFSQDLLDMAEKLSGLTIMEANELVEIFKEKYGIEPAAGGAVMAMPAGGAGGAAAEEEEEASSYKVVLKGFGDKKIQVIKAVRSETTLALKEAKSVVEDAPSDIKEGLDKEEAERVAEVLNEAGGDAEVQPE
jgi:large subunit ribosomal protein L7/L12